jgi:hypothetical protein
MSRVIFARTFGKSQATLRKWPRFLILRLSYSCLTASYHSQASRQ